MSKSKMHRDSEWTERCLLITGIPKSGTSLLMDLIDNHPNIVVYPQEPYFRDLFSRKYRNKNHLLLDAKIGTANPMHKPSAAFKEAIKTHNPVGKTPVELNEYLVSNLLSLNEYEGEIRSKESDMVRERVNFDFRLYFDTINELLKDNFYSLKNLMTAMIIASVKAASVDTKELGWWAFKDPDFAKFDTFFMLYLDGKAIITIRDPHAHYLSVKGTKNKQHGNIAELLKTVLWWQTSVINQLKWQRQYGEERVMILRYEDLVSDVEGQMTKVSDFLGVDFDKRMMTPTRFGVPNVVSTSTLDRGDKVYNEAVYRWKTKLRSWEKLAIDVLVGKTMRKVGYVPVFNNLLVLLTEKLLRIFVFIGRSLRTIKRSAKEYFT